MRRFRMIASAAVGGLVLSASRRMAARGRAAPVVTAWPRWLRLNRRNRSRRASSRSRRILVSRSARRRHFALTIAADGSYCAPCRRDRSGCATGSGFVAPRGQVIDVRPSRARLMPSRAPLAQTGITVLAAGTGAGGDARRRLRRSVPPAPRARGSTTITARLRGVCVTPAAASSKM